MATVNLELLATREDSSAVTHTFYVPCRAPDLIQDEAPRLYFAAGQATLSSTSVQTLGVMVRILRATPRLAVCLEGHADAQEARAGHPNPAQYLQRLGLLRAQAASDYLHQQGIAASRLSVRSVSNQQPLVPDSVTEYRTLNQCVVFKAIIAPPLVEVSSPQEKRVPAPPAAPHHRPSTLPPTRSRVNGQ
ncbi:OmpA family protein [Hymenobacter guriensis]|uniref:OmpA family protein n=1 Tax=Hymenobacter guriensis TaxID=2793065 RepID=UPI00374481A5